MADRPLLIFPSSAAVVKHTRGGGGAGNVHRPTVGRQSERLGPRFETLVSGFDPERLVIQNHPEGLEVEKALVLEIEGAIENFQNAVAKISGLEWLADWARDDLPADGDFYAARNDQPLSKPLRARFYVTMANRRGAENLVSLWNRYRETDGHEPSDHGLNRFRQLFEQLFDVRFWTVQDRLEETGLREIWEERRRAGEETIQPELELWPRETPERRAAAERWVSDLVGDLSGRVLDRCEVPEIDYHGLLIELPIQEFDSIFESQTARLIHCDDVMFLRPRGQILTVDSDDVPDETPEAPVSPQDSVDGFQRSEPRVGLLDGLPIANHLVLRDRLLVDDPDDWADEIEAEARVHGTAMASLVVRGDLEVSGEDPLRRPVYIRPVLYPEPTREGTREEFPRDQLTVDLMYRAVRRIFEGEGDEPPVAPSLVVICLSLGDINRPFLHRSSPWARLMDYLSYRYGVLFVISAGNHRRLELLDRLDTSSISDDELEQRVIQAVHARQRHRRLLSPAESVNALTIGALHSDASTYSYTGPTARDPMPSGVILPAYYSALGHGLRQSIKPEVLVPGGRELVRTPFSTSSTGVEQAGTFGAPGQRVASPRRGAGAAIDSSVFMRGTSNAAALASRAGGLILEQLEDLDTLLTGVERRHLAVVTKALLVHGCAQGDMIEALKARLPELKTRRDFARFLGYGALDLDRVLRCTKERATLVGFGDLEPDAAHRYVVPLPPGLSNRLDWRRLTLTLAWLTPIAPRLAPYRRAALWVAPFGKQEFENPEEKKGLIGPDGDYNAQEILALERKEVDRRQVRNGAVQHEVFDGQGARPFLEGDVFQVQVNCVADAGPKQLVGEVPYALAVTLEVAEGVAIPIYEEIRERLPVPVSVPV